MDIIEIIRKLSPYIVTAFIIIILVVCICFFSYYIYKKRGGKKVLRIPQLMGAILLLGWFVVVTGLTLFSRGSGGYSGWFNFRLFSGYVNAWNNWSLSEFQMIIFNMLMFLPLGFLLPIVSRKLRSFGKVLLISLLVTIGIETFQMLTMRGIFEFDDIFHNTLGSIIGYFIMMAIIKCAEERKLAIIPVLKALMIPMVFTLFFLGATVIYNAKELGNMPILAAIPQKMNGVKLELAVNLPETTEPVPMYHNRLISNMDYAKQTASLLEESFGFRRKSGMRIDGSNRVILYEDKQGEEFSYNYSLRDGSWSTLHIDDLYTTIAHDKLIAHVDYYDKWLRDNHLMPDGAVFSIQNETTLRWDVGHEEGIEDRKKDYFVGQIMIDFSEEIEIPSSILYYIAENKYVRDAETISPSKAYEKVVQGDFSLYNDLKKEDSLVINRYNLVYVYDTKGYYRPAYQFEGMLNSEPFSCTVPAMTK